MFLKFRVYWEEEDAIYRDVLVKHTQHFSDFHQIILKAFEFELRTISIFSTPSRALNNYAQLLSDAI